MFSDEKVERDLPVLQQRLDGLLSVVGEIPPKNYSFDGSDHFAFMLLAFLAKQKEHARSVLYLTQVGQGRDAGLIVRSMIEGQAQLKWAAQDLQDRPLRWRAFPYICEWRRMNGILQDGGTVSPDVSARIQQDIEQYGKYFWTKKAREYRKTGRTLPKDPYDRSWFGGRGYTQIFAEVDEEILKESLYSPYSAWHHWCPEGMAVALHHSSARATYSPPTARDSALALAAGFRSLVPMAQATDDYLGLGFAIILQTLIDDYVRSISGLAQP